MNKLSNLALAAGLGALSLTACGGSDGGGSAEGFCDSLLELENSEVSPETDFDGAMEALEDVKSNAPGDLKGELETFIDVMNKINDAGEDASFDEFEGDFEKMSVAIEKIQDYADANCEGLPEDIFN